RGAGPAPPRRPASAPPAILSGAGRSGASRDPGLRAWYREVAPPPRPGATADGTGAALPGPGGRRRTETGCRHVRRDTEPTDPSGDALEAMLRSASDAMDYPPTPHVARRVRDRLERRPMAGLSGWRRWVGRWRGD